MTDNNVVLRFTGVTFEYEHNKILLDEVNFSVRSGNRITLMGQNGAGKSSMFKMITGELQPSEGQISRSPKDATVAIARQVMSQKMLELTVREYFATAFQEKQYSLDKMIEEALEIVNLSVSLDKHVKKLSGGQHARLLLAHALIQKPDLLLLDEPTNNLDQDGINHLTTFLIMYEKTVLVISHDAEFLNTFSDGVLYLDVHTKKVEQYTGNYNDVVKEIEARIERENLLNARMQRQIKEKTSQAEVFAHKGGKLRGVAKRMRESAADAQENLVEVRKSDKTIRPFTFPVQKFDSQFHGKVLEINSFTAMYNDKVIEKKVNILLRKRTHTLVSGPNGIGKSTLLNKIIKNNSDNIIIPPEVKVGYYQQNFENLDGDQTAFDALKEVMQGEDEQMLRSTAAGFLLDGSLLTNKIQSLSEGQKGLLSFCRLVLMNPGLLILDEPTNHINFRHLPILAKALDQYEGALIMVSHIPEFVEQIHIDDKIDLEN